MSDYYRDMTARLLEWNVQDVKHQPELTLGMMRSAAATIERLAAEIERLNRENFWLTNKQREETTRLVELPPLKKGDRAYTIGRNGGNWYVKPGPVMSMEVEDGKICIHVGWVGRGPWGERVFATREEAEAAMERLRKDGDG